MKMWPRTCKAIKFLILATMLAVPLVSCVFSSVEKTAPYPGAAQQPTFHPNQTRLIQEKLYAQHQQWKGTRYAMGRIGRDGIDCSGFVFVTYRDQFGIQLPRATKHQSEIGREVYRENLRPGDLVFFKTSKKVRHVGIYIENDKFLHASTKKGVIISSLSNEYWRDKFWHARRVEIL